MSIKVLRKIADKSIKNAGPRYTPGEEPNAPNLNIQPLLHTIEFLTRAKSLSDKLTQLLQQICVNQQSYDSYIKKYFRGANHNIPTIKSYIQEYLSLTSNCGFQNLKLLRKSVEHVYKKLGKLSSDAWREKDKKQDSKKLGKITAKIYNLNKWTGIVSDLREITSSEYYELINKPRLLLGGVAGSGKTHFLCDLAKKKLDRNSPVLLILAQDMPKITDPLTQISKIEKYAKNKKSLLQKLSRLTKNNERALIIVDGINEGDYEGWESYYLTLCRELSEYPKIALLISARSPSDDYFIEKLPKSQLPLVKHYGFSDIEFDAVTEFFKYYEIPTPDYPLLDSELSNPLFLKLACETLKKIHDKNKIKFELNDIASGSKTFTQLFEDYVFFCAKKIHKKLGVHPRRCWEIIKGKRIPVKGEIGVASKMAENGREFIYPDEFREILHDLTSFSGDKLNELYNEFIKSGVIVSDIRWTKDKRKILRLPYQRISDHIIARSLLRTHLSGVKSVKEIKKHLKDGEVLGQLFTLKPYGGARYKKPELVEAIIMEFPEYTKRVPSISEDKCEIINFLPKENTNVVAFSEPFLSGLIWRKSSNFTSCTARIVSSLLNCDTPYIRKKALNVLSNLATRKKHPYKAERLYTYLSKLSLAERDLFWTEYLRESAAYSVRGRLSRWLSTHNIAHLDRDTVDNFHYILSLFLCSTDNDFRDITTKQIFKLGLLYPDILFAHTISSFDFNDPYMLERMLAASYGVAMHCYAEKNNMHLVCEFAKKIFEKMFKENAKDSTTHYIIRDYGSKLIELVSIFNKDIFPSMQTKKAMAPFSRMGIKRWEKAQSQEGCMPLDYEFRKKDISILANNNDRYNFTNPDQTEVEQKILWRIKKLGYVLSKFKFIDESIERAHASDVSNVTSYGMKYALIAFYELLGWRLDRGFNSIEQFAMSQDRIDVKIDPSFPSLAQYPNFIPSKLLRASKKGIGNWVKNGGVLDFEKYLRVKDIGGVDDASIMLNGSIFCEDKSINKRISIQLRGILINNAEASKCIDLIRKTNISNIDIPEPLNYYCLYAGEIPWGAGFQDDVKSLSITRSKRSSSSQILDISVMLPVGIYSWGNTKCAANEVDSAYVLSKSLTDDLKLNFKSNGMNFYNQEDKQISCLIKSQEGDLFSNHHEFLYISENVLKQYLMKNNLSLIWIIWGERGLTFEDINEMHRTKEHPIYQRFKFVRKYNS